MTAQDAATTSTLGDTLRDLAADPGYSVMGTVLKALADRADAEDARRAEWQGIANGWEQVLNRFRNMNRLGARIFDEMEGLRAQAERVRTLAAMRDVKFPDRFAFTPTDTYVLGYRAAQADMRKALEGNS